VLASNDQAPSEVYALENGNLRALTSHNQQWLKGIALGETREVRFKTADGADVHGLLTLPPDYKAGVKVPLLLRIHGGPNGQDGHSFQFERQLFAANGYAVLNVNYRGSAGRDEEFQRAIFADWGNKEVIDLLAGVDHVVQLGIADPNRLGIGGWSYGGILTDYTIAKDHRFKAAVSGAGSSLQLSMWGSDQYIQQYDLEIGPPWKNRDLWLKLSYPFFEADKIKTPTLFLGGQMDFNVPVIGSEQMYQALKENGVQTELVIYPGEFHGIRRPSYIQDRLERYLAWYKRYLGGAPGIMPATTATGQ
jgi:dipeptidyl aminopeptidase/acylaminoacyl peptidase